jgi:hypothetical protein
MMVRIPLIKVEDLRTVKEQVLQRKNISLRESQSLVGEMAFFSHKLFSYMVRAGFPV